MLMLCGRVSLCVLPCVGIELRCCGVFQFMYARQWGRGTGTDLWWTCCVASSVAMNTDVGPMASPDRGVRMLKLLTVAGGSAMRTVPMQGSVSGAGSAAYERTVLVWVWTLCRLGVGSDRLEESDDVGC